MTGSIVRCGALSIGLLSIILGLFLSGIPRQLGFFTIMPYLLHGHSSYGLVPAFLDGTKWGYTFEEFEEVRLDGQTALVTGANAGIGFSLSKYLAKQGATVYMACRNDIKCNAASQKIDGHTVTLTLDTSVLDSVRTCAEHLRQRIDRLDMFFMNAGTAGSRTNEDGTLGTSVDGIEHVFATNHVGHHLLYRLLSDKIAAAPVARIVLTSSAANYNSYPYGVATDLEQLNKAPGGLLPYAQSKLAQILWAQELTRRLGKDSTVFANAFHPGAVATEIWGKNDLLPLSVRNFIERHMNSIMWSCDEGALTGLYLGVHAGIADKTIRGKYYHPQAAQQRPSPHAFDEALQRRLWIFLDSLTDE